MRKITSNKITNQHFKSWCSSVRFCMDESINPQWMKSKEFTKLVTRLYANGKHHVDSAVILNRYYFLFILNKNKEHESNI